MMQNGENGNQDPNGTNFNFRNNRFALVFLLVIVGLFLIFLTSEDREVGMEIPYSQFLGHLDRGEVESVRILDQYEIHGTLKNRTGELSLFQTNIPYFDDSLVSTLQEKGVRFSGQPRPVSPWRFLREM
jgi:cell division protease FtsH